MFALLLALTAVTTVPGPAQSASCRDDRGETRCGTVAETKQRTLYDVLPAEEYARQKTVMMRAFFIDGYGQDIGLVTLWREPAAEPRAEWRAPRPRDGMPERPVMRAVLPLAAWNDVLRASNYFDRALVQRATDEPMICLHSWMTRVEMVDRDGKIRQAIQSGCGEDALVWPFANRMTATALAAMPACALLTPDRSRNDIVRLGKCASLSGDRAAAAEAYNVYDTPWLANPRGEDFARSLTYLFLEKLDFAWPGVPAVKDGQAAARLWSVQAASNPFFPRRTFGETADRVRMEGVILMPGATAEAARKPLPATMVWERCNGFGFRIARFWTGTRPATPAVATSCAP